MSAPFDTPREAEMHKRLSQYWKDALPSMVQTLIKTNGSITELAFYRGAISALECIAQGTRPEALLLEALETVEELQKPLQKRRAE